jgi:hypothetical protein
MSREMRQDVMVRPFRLVSSPPLMTDDSVAAFKATRLKHCYDDTMAQAICALLNALNGEPWSPIRPENH